MVYSRKILNNTFSILLYRFVDVTRIYISYALAKLKLLSTRVPELKKHVKNMAKKYMQSNSTDNASYRGYT